MAASQYRVTMFAVRAPRAILIAALALALALAGCGPTPLPPGSPSGANAQGPSEAPSPASTVVASVQPDPLIDLDCSDFAGVASIGTIAGVTERDPRGAVAEMLDVVSLADIVRNAGGVACEFSDGGEWRVTNADGGYPLNTSWRGAAIFIVPNVAAAAESLISDSSCGDSTNSSSNVCQVDFAAGTSWVTVVSSSSDRGTTFRAVRDHVKGIVEGAASQAGPIAREPGTFQPPRDCASLVPTAKVAALLGGSDVSAGRSVQLHVAAEATFVTENTGCDWWRDSGDSLAQVHVYPGGAWAAALTLSGLSATAVELDGILDNDNDNDTALSHCTDVSAEDFWICTAEVVVDGTWLRATGIGPDEATSTTIAVAMAEAVLSHRG